MFTFYVIGGVVAVLINLRFMIPLTYYDCRNAWGIVGGIKTLFYQLTKTVLLSCVYFFLSWISVGWLLFSYEGLKKELENVK